MDEANTVAGTGFTVKLDGGWPIGSALEIHFEDRADPSSGPCLGVRVRRTSDTQLEITRLSDDEAVLLEFSDATALEVYFSA